MLTRVSGSDSCAVGSRAPSSDKEVATIRELIDRMARTQPEASFLISPETGRGLTFQGLQEQSRFLSTQLRQAGLERGDKVAFLMDNGLFTAQLFLGAMYGGFVTVPLNVRGGVSQLSYMVDHCDAKVVFVGDEYATLMTEVMAQVRRNVQVIPADVDGLCAAGETPLSTSPLAAPAPEDLALLMYTSGSTGHPKAAVHTHRTVFAHGRNSVASHQLSSADRSLLVLPLYHINAECVTLIPTLLSGGSVVVPHRFSISHFWDWLDEYRCTWSAVVPTIISQLLDWQDPRADQRGAAFQRIRFLRSSSAPLAPSLHREFLDKFPLLLIQAMGSSEGGNVFSNPLPPGENKIGSTGLPWGFETRIINSEGAEVPQGKPGEVLIRGEALAQAYYKEPEATAKVFDSGGWLHTGDLAYRDADGYFFVIGRSKELIIKGGVNIAPRQIDDVLESHPAVLEAAAIGVPDHHLGEDLVAFVVLRAGVAADERELLTFCEGRLGHFKTPTRIYFAEDLPKGPSGKVQRLRLLDELTKPDTSGFAAAQNGFAVARGDGQLAQEGLSALPSSIEGMMADIWADLLKLRQVGVDDNFFALGGDSLLAIQCLSRLRDKLPVRLTVSEFFENGTIAQQAALIRERCQSAARADGQSPKEKSAAREHAQLQRLAPPASTDAISRRDRGLPYRLSPLQERVWFMEQLNPETPVYNEAEAARLYGELNVDAMERALNAVVARHEMLRTTIKTIDGQPTAIVHENWPLRMKTIDLSALTAPEREVELERLLITEPRVPYHLQDEPAIRATLIRLGPTDHALILMMHHVICDWSSEGVLWRELAAFYRSFCHGELPVLPDLPIQHGDYAVWQREQLTETNSAEDLAFWKENLKGSPALLELPADRPRPQVLSYRGARRRFRLNRTMADSLRHFSRHEKTSLFTLFTAALKTLVYRYTGNGDIPVGIPLAERDRPELQSVIGFMLHTHVLRTELSPDVTFRELVARVQKGVLKLYEHRSVPFDQVVRAVQPERNLSYSPLFQVMLNWRDRDQDLSFIGLEGLTIESLLAESRTSKFDLTLILTDMGDEIFVEMEYSTDLFDETRIERMFGHYQTLLEAVAADPERRLSELPLLTEAERHQVLVDWNETKVDYPANACIHELFEEQAKQTPGAVAVEFQGEQLTYADLNRRSSQFAQHLQALGAGPDVLVGIYVDRSLEMVIGLVGILKAGAAYLPIDVTFPQERIAFMVGDAQPPVLVTLTKLLAKLPPNQSQVVCVDDFPAGREAPAPPPPHRPHLAYALYTSGSTGKPKGVEICHRSVVNFLNSMRAEPGMEAQDSLLSVTTLSFDIFGLELWLPLTTGAKVVIAAEAVTRDGRELAALMERSGATVMQATPATWRMLLESGWEGNAHLKILCGGEAWPAQLAEQLLPKCAALWNMYGPTETTIWSAVKAVEKGQPVLIGRPIANTRFYVVDGQVQPVPVGVPGELLIGGEGLARGYWKRPELTAEKFIADPFSTEVESRLYRTGDLVRYCADGSLEFLGRIDQQVKIRGFRIELGEIESVLRSHSGVREAVAVVREEGEKQLVAYVVLAGEPACTTDELRDFLKQKLPAHMVPTAFSMLESLPLTANGKVDRKALSGTEYAPAKWHAVQGLAEPRTLLEAQLLQIWQQVLGARSIGVRDSFFDLGGHSLLAVRMIEKINKLLEVDLTVPTFFLNPTIEGIARALEQDKNVKPVPKLIPLKPGRSEGAIFFLDASIGLCRLAELLGEGPASFALSSLLPGAILEAARGKKTANCLHLEDMAAPLVALIKGQQISGPCVLVGYCLSGCLAFEVAHQLQRDGGRVDLIVLVDSWRISAPWWQKLKITSPARVLMAVKWRLQLLWLITTRLAKRGFGSSESGHARGPTVEQGDQSRGEDIPLEIQTRISRIVRDHYQWRPLETRGVVVRARDEDLSRLNVFEGTLGWGGFFQGGLEIVDVPGNHQSMLADSHALDLSQAIQKCVTRLANQQEG